MKTPLDSRSIDASPLVEMNIAIGGEGDAPAKRCGATMKINGDMAEAYDDDWFDNDEVQTYLEGATIIDNDFESQTVVATPITTVDEHTYAPIVIGITKGLYDHIVEMKQGGTSIAFSIITKDNEYTLDKPFLYTDGEGNYALLGLLAVDAKNSTHLSNDDWTELYLELPDGEEEYPFFNDKSFAPTTLIFTPAEQNEDENT